LPFIYQNRGSPSENYGRIGFGKGLLRRLIEVSGGTAAAFR
jgi:hypothetical protein